MSTLSHKSYENTNPLLAVQKMFELIANIAGDIEKDVKSCASFRDTRKSFQSIIPAIVSKFPELEADVQSDIEDEIISIKNSSRLMLFKITNGDVQFKHSVTKSFMVRELKLLVSSFSYLHETITSHIYSTPALTTESNDSLTEKLIEAWGEHAFQNY